MLRYADRLPKNAEVLVAMPGQSNGRPWGHRDLEGFVAEPRLQMALAGQSIDVVGSTGTSGQITLFVADVIASAYYRGAELRHIGQLFGNSTVNARVGRGLIIDNVEKGGSIISIDLPSDVFTTSANHALAVGDRVFLGGGIPGGTAAGVPYYVIAAGLTANTFKLSLTSGGASIDVTSAGAGVTWRSGRITVQYLQGLAAALPNSSVVTLSGTPANKVALVGHGLLNGDRAILAVVGGSLPAELAQGFPYYIVNAAANDFQLSLTRGGSAISFTGNGTGTITMLPMTGGYAHLAQTSLSFAVTMSNAGDIVNKTAHGMLAGDRVSFTVSGNGVLPPEVVAGVTYYVVNPAANSFQIAATKGGTAIVFTADSSGTACVCTPVLDGVAQIKGEPWKTYANVRVLTPYLPEKQGDYPPGAPQVPGFTFPVTVAGYADCGLFREFTWLEGIEGFGVSKSGSSVTYGANSLSDSTNPFVADMMVGAYVLAGSRYGYVVSNTTSQLVLRENWVGGTPADGTEYETAVPHWRDHPDRLLYGFRYPSNDRQPGGRSSVGSIYHRPRGNLAPCYLDIDSITPSLAVQQNSRFGAMIVFATRLSHQLGRRVNVVPLAVNSASQILRNINNWLAFPGTLGWWIDDKYLDWTPSNPDGLFARLVRMMTIMAPAALSAAGENPGKYVGIGPTFQGEGDAGVTSGRDIYDETLTAFYSELRRVINDAAMNPYPPSAKVPIVHPRISHVWESLIANADTLGEVNTAIVKFVAFDGFAATFEVDNPDNPNDVTTYKLNGTTPFGTDPGHFNGFGEARNGNNAADAMSALINFALSMASDAGAVAICNEALANIGQRPTVISLDRTVDASAEAELCATYYPVARDSVLAIQALSFSTKRVALVAIDNDRPEWQYAYAVPVDRLIPIAVQPPDATDDYEIAVDQAIERLTPDGTIFLAQTTGMKVPQRFVIELDSEGNQVLRTNQPEAVLRYIARVSDTSQFTPLFARAVAWHLSSLLAGSISKGEEGAKRAIACMQTSAFFFGKAAVADSKGRKVVPKTSLPIWMTQR